MNNRLVMLDALTSLLFPKGFVVLGGAFVGPFVDAKPPPILQTIPKGWFLEAKPNSLAV